ncbi:ATP-dependent RecD-like DNA helicase [Ornithinibacillus sp. BX22]|uniref:ATP-dependent RecD2 DNA helicase n=2 Tax=Ornithinibacillus TaxID=484508 RepID=A0A923RJ06_9BACI|nr:MULTISPECIES: ATP-dependent RecD-like DNA helicase [Ornithinibacillus]MBC5637624.1 ATP-dependent RecD-like DNA helicase [Ornithinibacillus hominis]MBS3679491.1 ATP-dependent RecD-like DNA helicase [Ornithinibacillus massiliensis]
MDQLQPVEIEEYIKGELLYTIFHNDVEHFSIAKVKILDTNLNYDEKEIVIKGYFSQLQEGTVYRFIGQLEKHPKYGQQYSVISYQTFIPDTKEGLIAYLASDMFYGIGKRTAKKVVDHLGESAVSSILNNPSVLDSVPGLKKEAANTIVKTLQENQGFEHVVVYLAKYNIGLKMAQKVYEQYKDETIELLEDDPYRLVFDVEGFGFHTADEIAKKNGLSLSSPNRIGAGCIYILQRSVQDGHAFLPLNQCLDEVSALLSNQEYVLTEDEIKSTIEKLNKEKNVILYKGKVYLPSLYYAEDGFASSVKRLISSQMDEATTLADLMKIIGKIEEEEILSYGKEQFAAIEQALKSKLMILTGGPGTGKTTVIKGIIKAYAAVHNLSVETADYEHKKDFPFVLAAPTGRAAKRLNESTGLPALTIHRLLGWNGSEGFEKNEHEPLNGKYLIIDEFSMVDIWLANNLFKAIPTDMQVLIVGDEDQLPSVGPGQVLTDLLENNHIPKVSLHEVYRQKEGSKIIQLAHSIKNDTCSVDSLTNDKDFSFIACREHQVVDVITKVFEKAMNKGLDVRDIQVLAPMYKSQAGITIINNALQALINPKGKGKREVRHHDTLFRIGDKVIQLVNQPEDHVYNGDIGEVVAIFRENENTENVEQLVVSFDEREVVYERKDYDNLMLAYCISIHKSQGSEFPIVILPVVSTYNRMLRKNLLYTAITRGQKSLIVCGEKQAFLRGIQTKDTNKRYTSLQEQLIERLGDVQVSSGDTVEEEYDISPYDFM